MIIILSSYNRNIGCLDRSIMKLKLIFLIVFFPVYSYGQKNMGPNELYPILFNYARDLYDDYSKIPFERKMVLEEIANYISGSKQIQNMCQILFVETDHSARSVLTQVWATTAAYYYGIDQVKFYSGGITQSSISRNAILAMEKAGFIIYKITDSVNPEYEIKFTFNHPSIRIKSIKYNDKSNPSTDFGSVIVCSNADVNLPVVKGNNFRTSLHYHDPAGYDKLQEAMEKYLEKNQDIATEMFYLFYLIKNSN